MSSHATASLPMWNLLLVLFWQAILTREVGWIDLVLACKQGSLVGQWKQDYKSRCAAVAICDTLVNIQTDTLTHTDII